ncbi:MAG: ABC transporter ATP-binding protein [Aeromicrobium sp.]
MMVAKSPMRVADAATGAGSARIRVEDLVKRYERPGGALVPAVDRISLTVEPGEFLVLVGPSGCGKTTLLRCLAGLERPDEGEIRFSGSTVFSAAARTDLPPERRRAAMLFQSYALWPHMKVRDNVAFPLASSGGSLPRAETRARVDAALRRVQCDHVSESYPGEISGGQQQRVALARALVRNDPIIFFDEPLSNIDAQLREELRIELRELQEEIGFSAIYVTHDQVEAMALADRIVVLRDGRIAQVGSPDDVYDRPESAYVARFMGAVNEFPGTVSTTGDDEITISTDAGEITLPQPTGSFAVGDAVIVMGRPARAHLRENPAGTPLSISVQVHRAAYLGAYTDTTLEYADRMLRCWRVPEAGVVHGSAAWLEYEASDLMIVPAELTTDADAEH